MERSKQKESDPVDLNSVPLSVGIFWILPMLCIAILTRFAVDTGPAFLPHQSRPVSLSFDGGEQAAPKKAAAPPIVDETSSSKSSPHTSPDGSSSAFLSNKPFSYQEVVKTIERRRLDFSSTYIPPSVKAKEKTRREERPQQSNSEAKEAQKATPTPARGASSDPARLELLRQIDQFRQEYQSDTSNLINAMRFADGLRMYDVQYHDGGSMQEEAITTYQHALKLALQKRQKTIDAGEETNRALSGIVDVNEEITLDYTARSIDGIICALHTALGKVYFMSNMFEKAVASYTEAIKIEPLYLDAVSARGSSLIILGRYQEAATDFETVIERDSKRRFMDAFTGLARVLQAKEGSSTRGWDPMIRSLEELIPVLQSQHDTIQHPGGQALVGTSLARLYHVLFIYHDAKTKDTDAAWSSLTNAYKFKMKSLPPWNAGFEAQKIQATKQIFHAGFWPDVGSTSDTPIFIIGFVRSGSTLLERILDAHPEIVGTGENSVFNGQLDEIRNKIVQTSMSGDQNALKDEIERLADGVVSEMEKRWDMVASNEDRAAGRPKPRKYVDKMLTNYYNVGFIHMLFPNALILHVAREPMDTIFSAYKHEFPPGPLDYTSSFDSLAELYHGYRDVMEHWDRVLPGRVKHIRYEDMVRDMPGVSRAVIDATGLEWHDEILDFHKKKQAVNTLSTTQVRKGIYTDSLQAWRKYEDHLQPLVKLIGDQVNYNLKTTVSEYALRSETQADSHDEF